MRTDCYYLDGTGTWVQGCYLGLVSNGTAPAAVVVAGTRQEGIPFTVPLTSLSLGPKQPPAPAVKK
jgi:hypothetical protein